MTNTDEQRYIHAYARIIGVREEEASEYVQRKGITSLVDNATQLLSTPTQREKHQAFLDLYRMSSAISSKNPTLSSPEEAAVFFRSVMDKIHDQEAFVVAYLNTKNRLIDYDIVSLGTINSSIVHPREVFRNAIVNKANSVIFCHNHPTGDLTPSPEDHQVTKRLKETGDILGITVLDHLIIAGINRNDVYSFKQHVLMEPGAVYGTGNDVPERNTANGSVREGLREITEKLEAGIRDFFSGEKYQAYLRTMSRFHHYSLNNVLLIAMQKPDATLVAGFNKWQDQFGRSVMKGERGIRIIAPAPIKTRKEMERIDPATRAPIRDEHGHIVTEQVEVQIPTFRVVSVFDVSQTEGKPLPQLAESLTGDVRQYGVFMEALRRSSPVPIVFEPLNQALDGYFSPDWQRIAIREGMSEVQTISATIHEIAHAKLHNRKLQVPELTSDTTTATAKGKNRRTEEVEAESVSYAVCSYYGIETGANSFGYIAAWSKDKELPELRASLESINRTASELIWDTERHFVEIRKEQARENNPRAHSEKAFLERPDDAYAIYQLKSDDSLRNHRFASMAMLQADGLFVTCDNYILTHIGTLDRPADTYTRLNAIDEQFNLHHPANFTGRSLSTSDVIVLKQNGEVTAHYADNIGFKLLPDFLQQGNPLRSVEDTVEQNDNQLDGLINNLTQDGMKTGRTGETPICQTGGATAVRIGDRATSRHI
jgi:DNA repair protein RadC/antirestriction protein ArdC